MACQIHVVINEDESTEEEFDNIEVARFTLCRLEERGVTVSYFSYIDQFSNRDDS